MWDLEEVSSVDPCKGYQPTFRQVSEKNTENCELLGRQARPEIEPRTLHLRVLRAEPLSHWWGTFSEEVEYLMYLSKKKKTLFADCFSAKVGMTSKS